MKELTSFLNASKVIKKLRDSGHDTFLVGGCVRDFVLGKRPKDFDIVTSAEPDKIKEIFPHHVALGESFGIIAVHQGDELFEVATFREDGDYSDGRRPEEVKFTSSLASDVKRRDFTINGMVFDVFSDTIIDLVGGKEDLKFRTVKTIGNPLRRFEEDKLRMMRAIRFATVLGFTIEHNTMAAIKFMSPKITEVSMERIAVELHKILVSKNRVRGMLLLKESGILKQIIPELDVLDMIDQHPKWHPEGNVWKHTMLALEYLESFGEEVKPHVAWATLFHDVGKPLCFDLTNKGTEDTPVWAISAHGHDKEGKDLTINILKRLKQTNDFVEDVSELVGDHMRFLAVPHMKKSKIKRLLAKQFKTEELNGIRQYVKDLSLLAKADSMASIFQLEHDLEYTMSSIETCWKLFDAIPEGEEVIKPEQKLITGKDLIARGLKPGIVFGKIIKMVEEAQLNDQISTKEEAEELVSSFLKEQLNETNIK